MINGYDKLVEIKIILFVIVRKMEDHNGQHGKADVS